MRRWLETHGNSLLRWQCGAVVIESYYAKEFERLGGELELLIILFEENGEMEGAIDEYMRLKSSGFRPRSHRKSSGCAPRSLKK